MNWWNVSRVCRQHEPKHLQLPCCIVLLFFFSQPSYPQRASAAQSQPFHSNLFSATHVPVHTVWLNHERPLIQNNRTYFFGLDLTTTRIARWKERHQERDVSGSLTWQLAHGWQSTVDASAGWTQKVEWVLHGFAWFCCFTGRQSSL